MNALAKLSVRGFSVAVNDNGFDVKPASRLDSEVLGYISENKVELHRLATSWSEVETAIRGCRTVRQYSAEQLAALMQVVMAEDPKHWEWFVVLFNNEAAKVLH